ncbi:MAG: hypothetical protein LBG81_02590 [Coriobacteriaceae bacterium]|jgi:alginate O-acetyltransferase complex protein AlgI|nr:hypothetical protein [Coriobacteriaceae bacterium]
MLFSSVTFLYWFLPVTVGLYYLVPRPGGSLLWRNLLLFLASVVFYAWGEPLYILVMLAQAAIGWASGLIIGQVPRRVPAGLPGGGDRSALAAKQGAQDEALAPQRAAPSTTASRTPLVRFVFVAAVVLELSSLLFFKYTDFFLANLGALFNSELRLLALALPLGISFYTFQILSYTIDLYRGKVSVQRNPLYFATYVTFFPQLIAGPIVRYADIERQLTQRVHSFEGFVGGIRRFCIGLGKKVIIANTLGQLVALAQGSIAAGAAGGYAGTSHVAAASAAVVPEQSMLFAALFLVAFSLQIYFDFSGYSDMAIGLGLMFGFRFPENFRYPFTAASVTDFWRRWHISMSTWFRDYVYIPLGGNRVSPPRHLLNILAVWMVTGFWHGAGWNFILWGLYMAAFLLAEKFLLARVLERVPSLIRHVYLLIVVALSWILFESPDLASASATFEALIGWGTGGVSGAASLYYLRDFAAPLAIGAIGCTPLPALAIKKLTETGGHAARALTVLEPLFLAAILIVVTAFLVDGSFNPFIYFRF